MPQSHTHELARKIEILLAIAIHEVTTFSISDMNGVPSLLQTPGAIGVFAGDLANLGCRNSGSVLFCVHGHDKVLCSSSILARLRGIALQFRVVPPEGLPMNPIAEDTAEIKSASSKT